VHLLFSDLPDALLFDALPLALDWGVVATATVDMHITGRSGLILGLTSVAPGDRLRLDARGRAISIEPCWRAADVVAARRLDDPERAGEELYAAVLDSVGSLSALYDNILLTLSGGLDSSIVAGALRETNTRSVVSCLNYHIDLQPSADGRLQGRGALRGDLASLGDERSYARSMAERCGYRLIERPRRVAALDIASLLAAAPVTIKPSVYILNVDLNQMLKEVSAEVGAKAKFGAEAGDTVFGATGNPLAALDAAAYYGLLSRQSLAAMGDTARLSRQSFWHVLAKALRYRLTGRVDVELPSEDAPRAILSDPAQVPSLPERLRESVSEPAGLLPPGKDQHARSIRAMAAPRRDIPGLERLEHVDPLMAQPVTEVCLQIPMHTLNRHGVMRGLARETFSPLLSTAVSQRRLKGRGDSLAHHLMLSNLAFVKEAALDGVLVRENVLDRAKLEAALSPARLHENLGYLLKLTAVELWVRRFELEMQEVSARRVA
jgi:asparagine synthase (glutamine-hydrolysing)